MKKLLLIVVISSFSLIGYSQIGFGLKGAVSMSSFSTNLSDYESAFNTGFQAGAFLRIGDKWHLQPEVYFSGYTGDLTYNLLKTGPTVEVKETVTLSSIDVPILLGFKIIDPPTLNVRLQAGPVASFVLNKEFDITLNGISTDPPDEYKNAWQNMNWAMQVGAGVDVLFLTIDLRYQFGLTSLYDQPENSNSGIEKIKSNLFVLSLGFKII